MATLDRDRMARSDPEPRTALTPDEFAVRFQTGARVLWTLAAGVLGDRSEAEDVLQEAFLAALSKLDQFDPDTNFLAWMGRFVRNVALNEKRKRVRRQTSSEDPAKLDGGVANGARRNGFHGAGSGAVAPSSEARGPLALDPAAFDDRLLAGLRELSGTARTCLLLRVVHELDYAAIAGVLAIPEGTAMSHVYRARLALRGWLEANPELPVSTRRSSEVRP